MAPKAERKKPRRTRVNRAVARAPPPWSASLASTTTPTSHRADGVAHRRHTPPTFTPFDETPPTSWDSESTDAFLQRFEANTKENLRALVEYTVALRMLEAFDCFLYADRSDCETHAHCRWLDDDKRKGGCVSKDDPDVDPAAVKEHKRLAAIEECHRDVVETVRLEVLKSLHTMTSQMYREMHELNRDVAALEARIDQDLQRLKNYTTFLVPRAKSSDDRSAAWQNTQVEMYRLDLELQKKADHLEKLCATLRSVTNAIDERTLQIIDEWVAEDSSGGRRDVHPVLRIDPLIRRAERVVSKYKQHRKAHPVPSQRIASKIKSIKSHIPFVK